MRQLPMAIILLLLAVSIGSAQDKPAPHDSAADQPQQREGKTEDDALLSPLRALDWMVGRWVDNGESATVTTDCSWVHNGKFLKRSFEVSVDDQVTLKGAQVVGWDPIEGQIRSWTFDTEGGFGEGRWIQDGNRWLIKTSFVLSSGERASALNVITYVDQDTFAWQSIGREIDGELQPSIPEVTIVRQEDAETAVKQSEEEESK